MSPITRTSPVRIALVSLTAPKYKAIVEPLGIEALAGDLRHKFEPHEVQVALHDTQLTRPSEIVRQLHQNPPDVLGLSIKLGSFAQSQYFLDAFLKIPPESRPILVLGNVVPTFSYQYLFNDLTLINYRQVLVVRGEGELALRGIVNTLLTEGIDAVRAHGPSIFVDHQVPGIAFVTPGGEIIKTPRISVLDPNDLFPPARDLTAQILEKGGIVVLEASRGCWGICSFCARLVMRNAKRWMPFPDEKVLADVKHLADLGAQEIWFIDDNFLGTRASSDTQRAIRLANGIAELKRTLPSPLRFSFSARADSFYHRRRESFPQELISALEEAGLLQIFVGFESGSNTQLLRYQKLITPEENAKAWDFLRSKNVTLEPGFIFFDPEMSFEELKENVQFVRRTGLHQTTSRIINEYRAQAGSKATEGLAGAGLLKPLSFDIDSASYQYEYRDPKVKKAVTLYRRWENKKYRQIVYALQGIVRANLSDAESRAAELLIEFRKLDFEALSYIVECIDQSQKLSREQLAEFRKQRDKLYSEIRKAVEAGTIEDKDQKLLISLAQV